MCEKSILHHTVALKLNEGENLKSVHFQILCSFTMYLSPKYCDFCPPSALKNLTHVIPSKVGQSENSAAVSRGSQFSSEFFFPDYSLTGDENAYRIPNPYATLVHQGKGTKYPR